MSATWPCNVCHAATPVHAVPCVVITTPAVMTVHRSIARLAAAQRESTPRPRLFSPGLPGRDSSSGIEERRGSPDSQESADVMSRWRLTANINANSRGGWQCREAVVTTDRHDAASTHAHSLVFLAMNMVTSRILATVTLGTFIYTSLRPADLPLLFCGVR